MTDTIAVNTTGNVDSAAYDRLLDDLLWLAALGRYGSTDDDLQGACEEVVKDYTDCALSYSDRSEVRCQAAFAVERLADLPPNLPPHRRSHYHLLSVWDPGGARHRVECSEAVNGLGMAQHRADELLLLQDDSGCDAIWIVGCGPRHCRVCEIPELPVAEWGEPHWKRDYPRSEVATCCTPDFW